MMMMTFGQARGIYSLRVLQSKVVPTAGKVGETFEEKLMQQPMRKFRVARHNAKSSWWPLFGVSVSIVSTTACPANFFCGPSLSCRNSGPLMEAAEWTCCCGFGQEEAQLEEYPDKATENVCMNTMVDHFSMVLQEITARDLLLHRTDYLDLEINWKQK